MSTLRVGLIGCGGMGTHLVRQCASLENVKITAVCDIIADRASKMAEEFGAECYLGYQDLLRSDNVDAVIVATHNDTHAMITIDAARAGKHIFCEKPMALSSADCDAMIAAAGASGVKLMVGQVLRLFPVFWKTQQIIASGEIGKPFAMFVQRTGQAGVFKQDTWRSVKKSCGGLLYEINAHEIDFIRFIMGEPVEVFAKAGNYTMPNSEIDDLAFVMIKFKDGGVATLHSSTAVEIGEYRNTIQCTGGTLVNGGFGGPIQYQKFDGELVTIDASEIEKPEPYLDELKSFVDSVLIGSPMVFDAKDGRATVAIAEAAYKSVETGMPVKL